MTVPDKRTNRGQAIQFILILLASTFLTGSSFVAGKILIQAGVPALLLAGWRFFVAALATLPLVPLDRARNRAAGRRTLHPRDVMLTMLIGLLQTAAVMGLRLLSIVLIEDAGFAAVRRPDTARPRHHGPGEKRATRIASSTKNSVWAAANQAMPASARWALPANPSLIRGRMTAAFSSQTSTA